MQAARETHFAVADLHSMSFQFAPRRTNIRPIIAIAHIDMVVQQTRYLILMAFITGNSSLEPLLEGLLAQIHIDLS